MVRNRAATGDRHGAGAEQLVGDDRVGSAPLAEDEREGKGAGKAGQRQDLGRAPWVASAAPYADQYQAGRRCGEQGRAQDVERVPSRLGERGRQAPQSGQGRQADREVHVEHPSPAGVLDDHATQQWPGYGGSREGGGDVALVARPLTRRNQVANGGHRKGHEAAGGDALDGAGDDQKRNAGRGPAERGGSQKQTQGDLEQALASVTVAQLAPNGRARGGRDHVGGHEPRHVGDATEVESDGGQGGGQDRLVKNRRQHRQHDRGKGQGHGRGGSGRMFVCHRR